MLNWRWLQQVIRGDVSPRTRTLWICAIIALSLVTAYLDARMPTLRFVALGILYVIALDVVGGFGWGLAGAGGLSFLFTVTEYLADPAAQRPYLVSNTIARLITYLLVVWLLEVLRVQTRAFGRTEFARQGLELESVRGRLAEADARFRAVGESIPFGVWHCDALGNVVYMSPSFLELLGMTLEQVREEGWISRVIPEDSDRIREAWRNRLSWQGIWEDEYRIRGVDDKLYAILCRGRAVYDDRGELVGWTGVNFDLTERSKARDQLRFLVDAGRILSSSLDPASILERIAKLAVPRVADWCAIDIARDDGELESAVVWHTDPSMLDLARELRGYPQNTDESAGTRKVFQTGQSELYADVPDELLQRSALDERHLALLRSVGFKSAVIVPLRAREKVLGVMTLAHAESGRHFSEEDLRFVEILAARTALSFDNARSYAKEQRVADTFQRASLPTSLPRLPGIRLRATYLSGANESEIGGDWYDAFALPDGRLAISIGDVAGKGLRAAVSMTSARQALRGCALEGSGPGDVLHRVNQLLTYEGAGMVTAVFGILDPVTLQFTFATAGHPAPLVATPAGNVEKLVNRGLPLGLFSDQTYDEANVQLESGSLLVLYTDGLTEFNRDVDRGERVLGDAVAREIEMQTPDPASAIVRRVILGAPKDDVAVLTVSISASPIETIDLVTSSEPANARVIRQSLRRFAMSIGLSETQTIDFLVACGEAISNVIEHAYGIEQGPLIVRAFRENGEVIVKVSDQGRWRAPRQEGCGRGMPLMQALMDRVDVECTKEGTTVCLRMLLSEPERDRSSDLSATRG